MAFGDILSGLAEAGHQHRVTLLQMDYEKKKNLADMYGKLAQDPNYPAEAREEFLKRAVGLHTLPPEKKLPKEWENMTITVQPPTPPSQMQPSGVQQTFEGMQEDPASASGQSPKFGLDVTQSMVQAPTPPSQSRSVFAPLSFEETLARASQTARMQSDVKTEAELREVRQRHEFLKKQFPGLPETALAAMATGHAPPNLSFSLPGTMDEKQVMETTGQQTAPGHYNVRMFNGEWMVTPVEAKASGGLKFAQNDQGQWVGYTSDQYGKIAVQQNLGLTPPQGVPTTSVSHEVRIVPTPDGGYAEVPITQTTTRTRPATTAPAAPTVEAPTPPPNSGAGTTTPASAPLSPRAATSATTATPAAPAAPTAPPARAGAGGARTIAGVGKSLTPLQLQNNHTASAAFDNMIDRLSGMLQNADKFSSLITRSKIRLSTDPQHEGRLIVTAAAAPLSQDEANFAADYLSLGEDINLIRGVFQATGFRGPEAFSTQQAQRGMLTGDFKLFKRTMQNTLKASIDQLSAINKDMTRAGQPLVITDGILRTYMLLNNNDENKALAALKRDGWQVQ